jgi:hypothetical protein
VRKIRRSVWIVWVLWEHIHGEVMLRTVRGSKNDRDDKLYDSNS